MRARQLVAVAVLAAAGGCSTPPPDRLPEVQAEAATRNSGDVALMSDVQAEAQARKDGDAATFASARAAAQDALSPVASGVLAHEGRIASLEAGATAEATARAAGEASTLASAKAYTDAQLVARAVPHLIAPDGTDLGVALGETLAISPSFGPVEWTGSNAAIIYMDGPGCTGNAYLDRARTFTSKGRLLLDYAAPAHLWRAAAAPSTFTTASYFDLGGVCYDNPPPGDQAQHQGLRRLDSGIAPPPGAPFTVEQLTVELR